MGRGSTVSVAGNICIDVLVRDVAEASDAVDGAEVARDGWGANVQLHQRPIEPTIGGGGVGLALVLAHFGHEVDLNTNLGTDPWGDMAARQVRAAGVSLRPPQPEASATNVILLRRDGRRTSHYYPGPAVDWKRSLEATAPSSESASIWFFASGFGRVEEEDLRQLLAVFAEPPADTGIRWDEAPRVPSRRVSRFLQSAARHGCRKTSSTCRQRFAF